MDMRDSSKIYAGTVILIITVTTSMLSVTELLPFENTDIPFELIALGGGCAILERLNLKITDNATWDTLWTEMHSRCTCVHDLPRINFTTEFVIAVFQGEQNTGDIQRTLRELI